MLRITCRRGPSLVSFLKITTGRIDTAKLKKNL